MLENVALGGEIGGADHQKEFSDFLLENDDQGNKTNVHKPADHAADHFHLEQFGQFPKGPNNHYANKNINGDGTFDEFVNVIEQCGHKDYVDDIRNLEFEKI